MYKRQVFHPWILFVGPSIHLWFLPFVAVMTLACLAVAPWLGHRDSRMVRGVRRAGALALLVMQANIAPGQPWAHWAVA